MQSLNLYKFLSICIFIVFASSCSDTAASYETWEVYSGSKKNIRYSSLKEIDTSNVAKLQVAWIFHTNDADSANFSQIQCNPIVINGVVFGTSPKLKLFAVDALTGKQKWVFDPYDTAKTKMDVAHFGINNNRGVTYWTDGKGTGRIFYTAGPNMYSIDVATGLPDIGFGKDGAIDLHDGLDREVSQMFVTSSSPGIIYKDLIIVGTRVDEGPYAAPGHIRAFDVRTGKRIWIFHTI